VCAPYFVNLSKNTFQLKTLFIYVHSKRERRAKVGRESEGGREEREGRKGETMNATKEGRQGGDIEGLHGKFYVNLYIVSAFGGQKPQFLANFDFWGLLYRLPFSDEGQIWCAIADPRHTLTCQISFSIGLLCRPLLAKTPNFCAFWTSAISGVVNWQYSEKDEHECTTTYLPLSNGIKIVSVLQRLHGEIGRTISDVQ